MSKKIVITNEKGGGGKSTISCLLLEYLNYFGKKASLLDLDQIQSSQKFVDNCLQEKRKIASNSLDSEYQIVDTAGSSGAAIAYLKSADWILVPFQSNYVDLEVIIDWYDNLSSEYWKKIIFIPNRWQNTLDQREGLKQLQDVIAERRLSKVSEPLVNRTAIYSKLFSGSSINFFQTKKVPLDALKLMEFLLAKFTE